jgi:hypothetical protein
MEALQVRGYDIVHHCQVPKEASDFLHVFVIHIGGSIGILLVVGKDFLDLSLCLVPFLMGDCLNDSILSSVKHTPHPCSWKLGGGMPLTGGVLYPEVLEPQTDLSCDGPGLLNGMAGGTKVVDKGQDVACYLVSQRIPLHNPRKCGIKLVVPGEYRASVGSSRLPLAILSAEW